MERHALNGYAVWCKNGNRRSIRNEHQRVFAARTLGQKATGYCQSRQSQLQQMLQSNRGTRTPPIAAEALSDSPMVISPVEPPLHATKTQQYYK